jgi:hypothetical protein
VQFARQVDYVNQGFAGNETMEEDTKEDKEEWLKTPMEIKFAQDEQEEWSMIGGSAGCEWWIKAASEQEPKVSMGLSSWSDYYILQEEQEDDEVSMQDDNGTDEYQDDASTSFDRKWRRGWSVF